MSNNEVNFSSELVSSDSEENTTRDEKENQKKLQRLEVYNEVLTKYNNQSDDMYKLSKLPFSNDTIHKNNVRLSTVQYGNLIIAFNEEEIQAILLKNTADLKFVEDSLSNLFDSEITIKNGEIIGTSKFVRGEDYPNNKSEYYIPIVTDEINYYPENSSENWQNDFLDAKMCSNLNNIAED